ncbi:MAG TPA: hypothetical protein VFS92_10330 [Planctomycetota bacterium]|nr:hypothetical protein [Planctomycetota bacterium]
MAYAAGTTLVAPKRLNDAYRDNQGLQQNALLVWLVKVLNRMNNCLVAKGEAVFEDGAAAGKIKITTNAEALPLQFKVNGECYEKAAADPVWDLSGQTDTPALEYAAFWLYLNAAGTGSIERASANAASAVLAKAVLLADGEPEADKAVVGVFVAGPETDFSMDAIVAVMGATIEYGFPEDLINPCGVKQVTG